MNSFHKLSLKFISPMDGKKECYYFDGYLILGRKYNFVHKLFIFAKKKFIVQPEKWSSGEISTIGSGD
jgi:hypothetical protein